MKVLLTATVQSHICQFHRPLVEMLHSHGYEVYVAARNNLAEKNGLKLDFVDKVYDVPFSRSPWSKDNIHAYKAIKEILNNNKFEVIHCNTPMGGVVTRIAARKSRKEIGTKVYYTAHGFHFYEGAPIINWVLYYPIEKILAKKCTDKLITISEADLQMARSHHFKTSTYRIHSVGINSQKYKPIDKEDLLEVRHEWNINKEAFVAICTGELNTNKNQQMLIRAVPSILKKVPAFKLLLAGNGPEHDNLEQLIHELEIEESVKLIGYRTDLEKYVNMSDIAISVSIREGLGINLLEAMLCCKPVIGSSNRGHREFIENGVNGFIVDNENFNEHISSIIEKLFSDEQLRIKIGTAGMKDALLYTDKSVIKELEGIYFSNMEK